MVQVASASFGRCQASACGSTKENANEKNSSFAGLPEKCFKMNKTSYFYPKFLEFQIMCCGLQMTPAARGPARV